MENYLKNGKQNNVYFTGVYTEIKIQRSQIIIIGLLAAQDLLSTNQAVNLQTKSTRVHRQCLASVEPGC